MPIKEGLKLIVELNQILANKGMYSRLMERLMYISHIRLNLAYALSVISQYMHNLKKQNVTPTSKLKSIQVFFSILYDLSLCIC